MTLPSAWRYRSMRLRESAGSLRRGKTIDLRLKQPLRVDLRLRERGTDFRTFHEVLVEEVYRPVLKYLPSCRTFVDLGANIGTTTLYIAGHFPGCRILAVEPNPNTYELLNHNLGRLKKAGRCRTVQAAAWAQSTVLQVDGSVAVDEFDSFRAVPSLGGDVVPIRGMSVQEIIDHAGFDQVDLMKIDIEGAEREIFEGPLNWLKQVRVLTVEFHGQIRAQVEFDRKMSHLGFAVVHESAHTTIAVNAAGGMETDSHDSR